MSSHEHGQTANDSQTSGAGTPRSLFALFMCCVLLTLTLFATQPVRAGLDSDMNNAIDKGVDWLLEAISEDTEVGAPHAGEGLVALETYALIVAGVDVKHPIVAKNLKRLSNSAFNHTYTTSCIIFALDAAINQIHGDLQFLKGEAIPDSPKIAKKYRQTLTKAVNGLLNLKQKDNGRWAYGPDNRGFDNSNTQFAVLGLGAGANRGVEIDDEVWEQIALHFIQSQQESGEEVADRVELHPEGHDSELEIVDEDGKKLEPKREKKKKKKKSGRTKVTKKKIVGPLPTAKGKVLSRGWNYNGDNPHSGNLNMTNAGVSSLLLARENLFGNMDHEFEKKLNRSIRDGLGFLMKNWNIHQTGSWEYYALYSLEKTGDLGHIKKFGPHDWFNEVATKIVAEQARDGSWPGGHDGGDEPPVVRRRTAFSLLILNRASSLLTARSRSDRMVLTGPGSHSADRGNRDSWVYLQSLDRELHVPSLFRTLRLRPNPKLVKLVNGAVDDFPFDKKGLLLPFLYKTYKDCKNDNVKKLARSNMVKITGVDYKKASRFMVWYRRWKDVEAIGSNPRQAKKQLRYLLKYYKHTTESLTLRKRIIGALIHCRSKKAAPFFIEDLSHEDPEVRLLAYDGLQFVQVSPPPPPFDGKAKKDTRKKQLEAIRAWFEQFAS